MKKSTIVALASGQGNAGIAVIRISGTKSLSILREMTNNKQDFVHAHMTRCKLYLDNMTEDAMVVYFAAPHSFTGEDVVEIDCHGGRIVIDKVIAKAIQLGAEHATRGEFSLRAFMNGKLTIDQAEGINDLVASQSEQAAKASSMLMQGALRKKVVSLQSMLKDVLASIEAKLDYPEYEITSSELENLANQLQDVYTQIDTLLNTFDEGKKVISGVQVAVVGAPNVGKSSLVNALVGEDLAIVSDIAGTTRDVVMGQYNYKGVQFNLFDTAGIRDSKDMIETIGVERAKKKAEQADIVLSLVNPDSKGIDIDAKHVLQVNTKADIYTTSDGLKVSAKTGEGIEELKEKIYQTTFSMDLNSQGLMITNARHYEALLHAKQHLSSAILNLEKTTLDAISLDINACWLILGEITGETASEEIINRIFSKFCLGK